MGSGTFVQQKVTFSHDTPDGCRHEFHAPAYFRGLDVEQARPVFQDGHAECSCSAGSHVVSGGIISIPYTTSAQMSGEHYGTEDRINLERRHQAGGTVI